MRIKITTILMTALLFACLPKKEDSDVRLVNGRVIGAETVPAAVQIAMPIPNEQGAEARCTATWVSANTIITAAHCVEEQGVVGKDIYVSDGLGQGVRSTKVIVHPTYNHRGGGSDIAVVIFKDNAVDVNKTAYIPTEGINTGAKISIVGYGKFVHSDPNSGGKKRLGTNSITSVGDRISFLGSPTPITSGNRSQGIDERSGTGVDVLNSQGDSGGPMFLGEGAESKIIGVSSTLNSNPEANGKHRGNYENLTAAVNKNWLLQTLNQGARINGLGQDADVRPGSSQGDSGNNDNNGDALGDQDQPIPDKPDTDKPDTDKVNIGAMIDSKNQIHIGFDSSITQAYLCRKPHDQCSSDPQDLIALEASSLSAPSRKIFRVPQNLSPEVLSGLTFSVMGYVSGTARDKMDLRIDPK